MVYEIARYAGGDDEATLVAKVQILSKAGALKLRDASGDESLCDGRDIVTIIGATPDLHEIRTGEEARISCVPEVVAELPFVLRAVSAGDDQSDCYAKVNDDIWAAFPTVDGNEIMLPGGDASEGPDMDPCWAEYQYGEGESNPLVGDLSIGLVAPGVAVEYGRCDHGGMGGDWAVVVTRFEDFAAVFVPWLRNTDLLDRLWGGDSAPGRPNVELFAEASSVADQLFYWDTDSVRVEREIDGGDDEEGVTDVRWEKLQLHLPAELVAKIRAHRPSPRSE